MHSNLPDSGLAAIGADSIEHGTALGRSEIEALGARGGAWTPTLCAVLRNRDSPDPDVRKRTEQLRERLRGRRKPGCQRARSSPLGLPMANSV